MPPHQPQLHLSRVWQLVRFAAILSAILCTLLTLSACVSKPTPTPPPTSPEAAASIIAAYDLAVERALSDPDRTWHCGWTGNIAVRVLRSQDQNQNQGHHQGLCIHWQREVYQGVSQTAAARGWLAMGIFVNRDDLDEHHAVVVFDPHLIRASELLTTTHSPHAFVLDPWHHGRPEVFTVNDWLKQASPPGNAGIEDLAHEQLLWHHAMSPRPSDHASP